MIKICLFILIFFLFHGCATRTHFVIKVDSITDSDRIINKKFLLLPGMKDVTESDLQYREYKNYVEKALTDEGFVKSINFNEADIAIFLSYGIGNPETTQYSYLLPTWGQTGISSSNTTGSVNVFGSIGHYSETTTYTPKYGITGYQQRTVAYTTYFRFLVVDAIDLIEYRKSKRALPVWKTTVTSTGTSGDLRRVFPLLVAASKRYFGRNTGQTLDVVLRENNPEVLKVKGIRKK